MTLVVSSHILAELEDYSDRMVIVDKGRIAGGETIALKGAGRLRLKLAAPHEGLEDFLKAQGAQVLETGPDRAVLVLAGDATARAALLAALVGAGFAVAEFTEDTQGIENVYFAKIGGKT
jgi:ABC-2 type transport system ATP-binding protein